MNWWFKITTNMYPVFVVNNDEQLARDTLRDVPGGHVFGPFTSSESARLGADNIMAADEAAMGGN